MREKKGYSGTGEENTVKHGPSQTQAQHMPPGLYIVATPIGNLQDITLRALEVLKRADLIACEDTRESGKLLSAYGIKKPTLSYNDHNGAHRRPQILEALREGKMVALVSDAGTPLISDPGYKLVKEAQAQGFYVTVIPGASSVMAALCLSGLPTDQFFFAGFLPPKSEACRKEIQSLANLSATLVLFESPKRLEKTLALLYDVLGNREAAVVREITKLYEETRKAPLSELIAHYKAHGEPKGEVVLVIEPAGEKQTDVADIESKLSLLLATHSVKEAASIVAEETSRPRKEIYSLALELMKAHDKRA
jgi:16S rRNA (cytidine1402-2'-O)-methyltransferase